MPDFFQNGAIATLHNLTNRPLAELEADLTTWGAATPLGLIVPSLFSELGGDALGPIVDELTRVPYLDQIIVGLDRADRDQFTEAKAFFDRLPQTHVVLWNDGPGLRAIDEKLRSAGLAPSEEGKGRNVWYCLGYLHASGRVEAVALHDADILTYERELLARLLYPIAHPDFDYHFAKGYYYRSDGTKLNGRVMRLLVTPLIRALKQTIGTSDYLEFLDSFRYPLAGEFAMRTSLSRSIRVPSDWGLEIGLLAEVHRHCSTDSVCQVDIAGAYDHKHQDLSADDETSGLNRMSFDIAKAVFRKLAADGVPLSADLFHTLSAATYKAALEMIDRYHADAVMNGLRFDIKAEQQAAEVFSNAILTAGERFLLQPRETRFIPSWSQVHATMPDILDELRDAVDADQLH